MRAELVAVRGFRFSVLGFRQPRMVSEVFHV
jgi:hypothetical protein